MTTKLETNLIIRAPINEVWQVLADFGSYCEWNSWVQLSGTPCPGTRVQMTVKLFGLSIKVPVLIETLQNQEELRWRGGIRWLITGSHYFQLRKLNHDAKATQMIQGEDFQGILVPIILPFLNAELNKLYTGINSALQSRMRSSQNV